MLTKTHPLSFAFARDKRETKQKALSKTQRVSYDRLVMLIMFVLAIVGAVIYA